MYDTDDPNEPNYHRYLISAAHYARLMLIEQKELNMQKALFSAEAEKVKAVPVDANKAVDDLDYERFLAEDQANASDNSDNPRMKKEKKNPDESNIPESRGAALPETGEEIELQEMKQATTVCVCQGYPF